MNRFVILITILSMLLLTACEKNNPAVSSGKEPAAASKSLELPKVDLSTPEKTIYSYQAVLNWEEAYRFEVTRSGPLFEQISEQEKKIQSVTFPLYQDRVIQIFKQNKEIYNKNFAPKYELTIEEMKKETDTRVVAMVKAFNITTISGVVEPDDSRLKWRKEGERFKIALELENARWLIADISTWDKYGDGWQPCIEYSGPNRPLIPFQIGHPIRSKSAGYSGANQATHLMS